MEDLEEDGGRVLEKHGDGEAAAAIVGVVDKGEK